MARVPITLAVVGQHHAQGRCRAVVLLQIRNRQCNSNVVQLSAVAEHFAGVLAVVKVILRRSTHSHFLQAERGRLTLEP